MRTLWKRNKDKQENGPKAEKQVIPETQQIEETTLPGIDLKKPAILRGTD